MRSIFKTILLAGALVFTAHGQTSGKAEFEAASIRTNPPQAGFHFASDAVSGGPGTPDPGMFRCSKCTLATLIAKAFQLQPYQFPGRTSLADTTYEVQAAIPAGASKEDFSAMLQNLLKDRFGLVWHFQEKKMKGYRLVIAKGGSKLKESTDSGPAPSADPHRAGQGQSHSHSGAMVFGSSGVYRAADQSVADLARVLSDQTGVPVDDETGLTGKYEIALRWSGATSSRADNHSDGGSTGGYGHGGHDGGGGAPSGASDPSGPTLFDALQQQLGLKLVPAEQAVARLFVVDRLAQRPTAN
ncbi:MAG: TIGR03435 family protein [Bryobacteraceae bacterium]